MICKTCHSPLTDMGVEARCPSCDVAELKNYNRITREIYCRKDHRTSIVNWRLGLAVGALSILAVLLACSGCVTAPNSNLAVTINLLSSHSRYGQSQGGTNTTIKGQIEGGGALTATVPMTP